MAEVIQRLIAQIKTLLRGKRVPVELILTALFTSFILSGCVKDKREITPVDSSGNPSPYHVRKIRLMDSSRYEFNYGGGNPFIKQEGTYTINRTDSLKLDTSLLPRYCIFQNDTFLSNNPYQIEADYLYYPSRKPTLGKLNIRQDSVTIDFRDVLMMKVQRGYILKGVFVP